MCPILSIKLNCAFCYNGMSLVVVVIFTNFSHPPQVYSECFVLKTCCLVVALLYNKEQMSELGFTDIVDTPESHYNPNFKMDAVNVTI